MKQEKEEFYNMVKESGELFIFFEDMSGDWEKDKVKFTSNFDNIMNSINEIPNDPSRDTT